MTSAILALLLAAPASAAPRRHAAPAEPAAAPSAPLYTRSTEPITFVWPPEGMVLAADGEFILGSINPATAHFTINGTTVAVHRDGGFLHWTAITAGTFTFRGELTLSSGTATAERRILVPPYGPAPQGHQPDIDPSSLQPKAELDLRAGH